MALTPGPAAFPGSLHASEQPLEPHAEVAAMRKALETIIWLAQACWKPNVRGIKGRYGQRVPNFHVSGDNLRRAKRSATVRPQVPSTCDHV